MLAKFVIAIIALALALPVLACSGAPAGPSESMSSSTHDDLDVVHQIVVRTNPDGTVKITHVDVPIAQVEAMLAQRNAARAALQSPSSTAPRITAPIATAGENVGMTSSAISAPTGNGAYPATGCGNNDLWLFSTSNDCMTIPRGTYQLCYNAGSDPGTAAYLSSVSYTGPPAGDTWYQHVVTYSPGDQSGAIDWDVPGDDGCWQSWGQNDYFSCHQAADTYNSNPDCSGYVGTNEVYL